uniref:Uncharacterized protein n=1 Tax=Arundo donax TaxID=35708 RepID=A0A0A9FCC7_ARUDO
MDSSHRNFTQMLNQGSPSQYSDSSQNSPPTPQSHFQFTPPNFLQNFNPFGTPGNQPPYGYSSRFQGPQQQGGWVQPTSPNFQGFQPQESFIPSPFQFGSSSSRPPSVLHFGGAAATNSAFQGAEFTSPCPTRQKEKEAVNIDESSDSSEEEPKRGRINWSEEENLRLLSSWLHSSVDPVNGNDKKSEYYWKEVVATFNSNAPPNAPKRSVRQLRTHWGGVKRDITKFCGLYGRVRSTWSSGESDEMIMNKAHVMYKKENKDRPFTLEYMWKVVKDLPKWRRVMQKDNTNNKRTKNTESGAYTSSSNQETEEESVGKEKRPEGQKTAKARLKGKGKSATPSPLGSQPSQNMIMYREAMSIKAAAMQKSSRDKMYRTYLKLLDRDTSTFNEAQLKRHELILDQLAKELAEEE